MRIKGSLCFCHGYGDTCTFFFEGLCFLGKRENELSTLIWCIYIHLCIIVLDIFVVLCPRVSGIAKHIAASGYGVYAIDHPGFGLSEGLHGYIPSFDAVVDNVIEQFTIMKGEIPTHQWSYVNEKLLFLCN